MSENQIEKSEKDKVADLIVENQLLNNEVMVLSQLALGAALVLDYYASTSVSLPIFTLVNPQENGKQPLYSKAKYKVVEVLDTPGPDKEALIGMEMYEFAIDTETAKTASKQIKDKFEELGIKIENSIIVEDKEIPLE